MTRSSGKSKPQDSSNTGGNGSTTWRGTRTTGLICASPLCESTMASTRVRKRESRRDHRLPSAFLTPKAPRLTEMSHRRSRSVPGAIMETRARKRERSHRQRVTNPDPSRRSNPGTQTRDPMILPRDKIRGGVPEARKR